jgi:long-chain acyl-CoA synthetase
MYGNSKKSASAASPRTYDPEPERPVARAQSLRDFFERFAEVREDFVVYDDGYRRWRYSYRQIASAARNFACKLRSSGIEKGDKVLIWSENRPEWLVAFWGCVLQGVIVVPIDYRASIDVVRATLKVVGARCAVTGSDVKPAGLAEAVPVWRMAELDLESSAAADTLPPLALGDVAEIVFTSGSTAAPKGVVITHQNILADLAPIEHEVGKYRRLVRLLRPVRFLNLLPLSHMFGQALATFFPPMLPGTVVFMRSYAARDIARLIRRQRIAFLVAVPKILEVMRRYVVSQFPELARAKPDHSHWLVRRWRYRKVHRVFGLKFFGFVVGGAPLDAELEEFWRRLGFMVVQGYGLTETAPIVSFNHPFHLKPLTAGRPLPGVNIRIDPDGEILVQGDIVSPGYFNAPAEASKAFESGWFHTGDIGFVDPDGYLVVRGRKKEMIVTPEGLKIFPDDVELVLNQIRGVRESAVVGRQRAHAVLVLEPGADKDEIVRRANSLLEEHQKIRGLSVWTGGALPRTEGTGKLKRPAIQKWVDAGTPSAAEGQPDELTQIIRRYAPHRDITQDTNLEELGLSSLEMVELMVELEAQFNTTVDEAAFTKAQRVGDLQKLISLTTPAGEEMTLVEWNRGLAARVVRRLVLGGLALPLTRICAHLRVVGAEMIGELKGPAIFASNHQSHLDTPVILAALPRRWRYRVSPAMLKEFFDAHFHPQRHSLMERLASHLMFVGATLVFNGFPLPQREAGTRQTIRHIGELVSEGWSILIFPEGERTLTGAINPFQAGVGMLAAKMRVPVIPVRLRGVDRVLRRGSKVIHPGPVEVRFGAPLNLTGEDFADLSRQVEAAVCAL